MSRQGVWASLQKTTQTGSLFSNPSGPDRCQTQREIEWSKGPDVLVNFRNIQDRHWSVIFAHHGVDDRCPEVLSEIQDACSARLDTRSIARITVTLHGSLAFTGKGHATDNAVCLGLLGETPAELDPDMADARLAALKAERVLRPVPSMAVAFDPETDLVFDYGPPLHGHPNGTVFRALDLSGQEVMVCCYYSIGGGFVVSEEELDAGSDDGTDTKPSEVPFLFEIAAQMLAMGDASEISVARMIRANEEVERRTAQLDQDIDALWNVMCDCIDRGLCQEGVLPGRPEVLSRSLFGRDHGRHPRLLTDVSCNRRADQAQCLDFGRGTWMPGRGGIGRGHGSGRFVRGLGRIECTGRERRRNRPGTSSWHDLRPGCGACANPLHRAERNGGRKGGRRLLTGAPRGRFAFHAARHLHRGDSRNGTGHER